MNKFALLHGDATDAGMAFGAVFRLYSATTTCVCTCVRSGIFGLSGGSSARGGRSYILRKRLGRRKARKMGIFGADKAASYRITLAFCISEACTE